MASLLFDMFGKKSSQNNAVLNILTEIENIKRMNINPRAEVENLLKSGKMTQEQFEQFGEIADQFVKRN